MTQMNAQAGETTGAPPSAPAQPAGGSGTPPPAPAPQQTPQQTPQEDASGKLSRDTEIILGEGKTARIGDMADVWEKFQSIGADDSLVKEVELYRKAIRENDPAAAEELWKMYRPAPTEPEPSTPEEARYKNLEDRLNQLNEIVTGRVMPLTDRINIATSIQNINAMLEAKKNEYPFLARHRNAAALVESRRKAYEDKAAEKGHRWDTLSEDIRSQVIARSMEEVNRQLQDYANDLGFQAPPAQPSSPAPNTVNDQDRRDANPNYRAPRYQQIDGQWVDMSNPPSDSSVQQPGTPLPPAIPVTPAPGAAAPGVTSEQPAGPMTLDRFRNMMRQRASTLQGIV